MSDRDPTKQLPSSSPFSGFPSFSSNSSRITRISVRPATSSMHGMKDAKEVSGKNSLFAEEFKSLNGSESKSCVSDVIESKKVNWHEVRGETRLHVAARKGDVKEVEKILKEDRALITQADTEGRTPLYLAVEHNAPKKNQGGENDSKQMSLEEKSCPPNLSEEEQPNYIGVLIALLNADEGCTTVCRVDKIAGMTPLFLAASTGNHEAVMILLAKDKDRVGINQADISGRTPLTAAAFGGHIEVAVTLIRQGAHYQNGKKWLLSQVQDLLKENRVKTLPIYTEALINLDAACRQAGKLDAEGPQVNKFTNGFLISLLQERIVGGERGTQEQPTIDKIVAQFWRDAGVGGGKEKESSQKHRWLEKAIEAQPALSSSFFNRFSCFQEKMPETVMLEDAKKFRKINNEEQTVKVSYIFTAYNLLDEGGRHAGSSKFAFPIIITSSLSIGTKGEIILETSLAIAKQDAALLGLQWYFPGWFSPPERAVSRIKFFLKIFETHARELRNRKSLDPINEKAFIDAYIGPSSTYLKEVIEISSFQRFLSGDQQDILANLHKIYRANQCSCLVIAAKKFETDEDKVEWLFWRNTHRNSYEQLSVGGQERFMVYAQAFYGVKTG